MAKSNTMNMTSGSIMGPLIKYSIPIMLTGILQLLFNTADIIVVGQFVNEKAVAAVSASAALINLLINQTLLLVNQLPFVFLFLLIFIFQIFNGIF